MCGICGQLSWGEPPDRALVERMNARLAHRGPDGSGVTSVGPVVLGHRRLAIIDLSSAGGQPMADLCGEFWITFNGEIYNFKELRAELAGRGARFQSRSDTEVIIEAYKMWGVEAVARLHGMFAFALWDNRAGVLLLARDRLGKKPLYFHVDPHGRITFASEMKALCEDATLRRVINPRAFGQYLSLGYTLTSDSILQDVHKLRPGHLLVCSRGQPPLQQSYWDLPSHFLGPAACRTPEDAAEALRALVDDAVRVRLMSDVPLGAFLSGGIDSSTIVASMAQTLPRNDVHSFSVGFEEASYGELDEARFVAGTLGIVHRDMVARPDAASLLPVMTYQADEPFADTSMIPTYLLSEFTRRHVTVSLSGDGGDELFGGYETYVADTLHHLTRRVPAPLVRSIATIADHFVPVSFAKVSADYKLRQFLSGHGYSDARAHYHWRTIFSEDEKRQLLSPPIWREVSCHDPFEEFQRFDRDVKGCHYLNRASYVDIKTWLADDILVKVDRASMAHGLEVRAPFLDHRVVEFAASLPADWKLRGLRKKFVLKASQAGRLPDRTIHRRKQGFNAPVSHWLMSALSQRVEQLAGTGGSDLFDARFVRQLWDDHLQRRRDNGLKLLVLINFQLWSTHFEPGWN